MMTSQQRQLRSWKITLVRKILRAAAFDPKEDTLWRLLTDETHPDAHKALVCRAILDINPMASVDENWKNLMLAIRHAVQLWMKMYDPNETNI